jgi:hypothetical protein
MSRRRWWTRLITAVWALWLVGCQADVRISVTANQAGVGQLAVSLVLDAQAAARIGDVGQALQLGDLERAGWQVSGPRTGAGGSVTTTISHAFGTPAQASSLLEELSAAGPGGPRPVRLSVRRGRGLTSSSVLVGGDVDLRGGVDAFADDGLRQALGVTSLQAAIDRLRQDGDTVPTVSAEVVAALPGRPVDVTPGGRVAGDTVTWTIPLGGEQAIGASAVVTSEAARRWLAVAAVCLVALVLVAAWGAAAALRRRPARTTPARRRSPHPVSPPG